MKTYISGVRFRLRADGQKLDTDMFILNHLIKGTGLEHTKFHVKLPITLHMLPKLVKFLEVITRGDAYERSLFQAIFVVAYFGLVRISEFCGKTHSIRVKDVLINRNEGMVHTLLLRSKANKTKFLERIILSQYHKQLFACSVHIVDNFMAKRAFVSGPKTDPFFVHRDGRMVMRQQVLKLLRKALRMYGMQEHRFGTDSFRAGHATDMHRLGIFDKQIMRAGRWKSRSMRAYMGVSHENCVGDFYGRVVVFRVLLTTTHNETQRDNTNFSSDYTDNIDN